METATFNSSNLDSGTYDPDSRVLTITFNTGATYEYSDVPPSVWSELCNAASAGSYFSAYIRNEYPCERI